MPDLVTNMKRCTKCQEFKPLKKFTQSKRLPDGHTAMCKICTCARQYAWRENNRDKTRAAVKRYSEAHPELIKARTKKYQKTTAYKNTQKIHYEKQRASGYKQAWVAAYRANKIKATPKWVDKEKIKYIYKNCPKDYHVDHIIPLRGATVCGLHVENNLQYLIAKENMQKSNKLMEEYV